MRAFVLTGIALAAATSLATDGHAQDLFGPTPAAASGSRTLSFAKLAARIPAGTPWARIQANDWPLPCADNRTLTWDARANAAFQDPDLERVLREELSNAGVSMAGDPNNLFEQDRKVSELQLGALITSINATFCAKRTFKDTLVENGRNAISGSADLSIEWQVYSTVEARVVARIPTSGRFETKDGVEGGNQVILQRAFAENVRGLAASPDFRRAVSAQQAPSGQAVAPARSPIAYAPSPAGAVAMSAAVKSVVSIFAGEGHGSGVLISSDGYVLTNHHVAGDAGRVRIRWSDGSETPGEVVRSDKRRDVALIKTSPKAAPLAIRATPAQVGETVFAVGTPLDKELSGTVTRGIVSSSRVLEGQPWIQSDVAVTNGNSGGPLLDEKGGILGLTSWGVAPNGASANLNFFIPIEDALKVLGLSPAG